MRTRLRFAALLAMAAVAAAACGDSAPTRAPTVAATAPAASAPAGPTAAAGSVAPTEVACSTAPVRLALWTTEGDPGLAYVRSLTARYTTAHPNVTFEVTSKDVEVLGEDFQAASLAGAAPEILWTVADQIGPFTAADLITPLDDMVDGASYVPLAAQIATADGRLWGAPISFGSQLMLYWNKALAGDAAPADSDALVAKAKELTMAPNYGLVFNQTESFWLVPFLGGFGGKVFADDGETPTLNTHAMTAALTFMHDLKYTDRVMPSRSDYATADGLFKAGKAGMIINGDWAMADYVKALGDKLGVGPIPQIAGNQWPAPYVAGTLLMASKAVGDDPNLTCVVSDFLRWATARDEQVNMVKVLQRLPGNAEAFGDPIVTGDALLAGAAAAVAKGIPQPANVEMRCVTDAMTAGVRDMAWGNADVAGIARTMQIAATTCIAAMSPRLVGPGPAPSATKPGVSSDH